MSVSTLTIGRGAATPVNLVNLSIAYTRRFCSGRFSGFALHQRMVDSKALSDHIELTERPAFGDALIAEGRAVDRAVAAMRDQLGNRATDRRRLLQAVA